MLKIEVRRNDFHQVAERFTAEAKKAVEETSMDLTQAMHDSAPYGLGSSIQGRVARDGLHAKVGIQAAVYRRIWWVTFVHWGTRFQPSQPWVLQAAERQRAWFIDRLRRAWEKASRG